MSLPFTIMWETLKQAGFFSAVDVVLLIFIVIVAHVNCEHIQGFTDCRLFLMHLGLRGEYVLTCFCYLFMLPCDLWNILCEHSLDCVNTHSMRCPWKRLFLSLYSLYYVPGSFNDAVSHFILHHFTALCWCRVCSKMVTLYCESSYLTFISSI